MMVSVGMLKLSYNVKTTLSTP